jgi:hypothetical protein
LRLLSRKIGSRPKPARNYAQFLVRLLTLIHQIRIERAPVERCLWYRGCLQSDPFWTINLEVSEPLTSLQRSIPIPVSPQPSYSLPEHQQSTRNIQTEQTDTEDHRAPMVVRVPVDVEDEEQNSERKARKTWQRAAKTSKTADLQWSPLVRIQDDGSIIAIRSRCVDSSSLLQWRRHGTSTQPYRRIWYIERSALFEGRNHSSTFYNWSSWSWVSLTNSNEILTFLRGWNGPNWRNRDGGCLQPRRGWRTWGSPQRSGARPLMLSTKSKAVESILINV